MWFVEKVIGLGVVFQEMETLDPCTSRQVMVARDCPLLERVKKNPKTKKHDSIYLFISLKSAKIGLGLHTMAKIKRN